MEEARIGVPQRISALFGLWGGGGAPEIQQNCSLMADTQNPYEYMSLSHHAMRASHSLK